ncbi:MAG: MBL fold metallo-hydrolase, partial [Clostridia bacterium]|nr:MBL fold metallo-hydrolase [Clostridia bacterium]
DHNELSKATQKEGCKVIRAADALVKEVYNSFDVDGVKIKAVPAYNKNHSKLNSLGYVLEFDGIKLYHAGDTSKIPEMADLAREKLQYALLPVDGVYNMDAKEASECAELIKAENYIPIHSDGSKDYNETNVADFAAEKKISVKPGDEIALN